GRTGGPTGREPQPSRSHNRPAEATATNWPENSDNDERARTNSIFGIAGTAHHTHGKLNSKSPGCAILGLSSPASSPALHVHGRAHNKFDNQNQGDHNASPFSNH